MTDDQPEDSDIRRRAAWLLAMLALVAALFVALMVTFFNTSGGDDDKIDDIAGPTDSIGSSPSSSPKPSHHANNRTATSSGTSNGSASPGSTDSSTSPGSRTASCPDRKPCALDNDIGNAVDAINAYRTQHGKSPVPGSVSDAAKTCALNNGTGCKGGWAETQVPKPDGDAAVKKILQFGKLLSDMKAVEVGWAYDPGAKQYYFAIIRQD